MIVLLGDWFILDGGCFFLLFCLVFMFNGGVANLIVFRIIFLEDFVIVEIDVDIVIYNIIWLGEYFILEFFIICYDEDGFFGIVMFSGFSIEVFNKGSVFVFGVFLSI